MARRIAIPSKHIAAKVVGPRGDYLMARVQRFDAPQTINSTDIDELGNPNHAGNVTDIPEITPTLQLMDVSVKAFAALTGTDEGAWPAEGVGISSLREVDIIGVIKDADVADYVKTMHIRKCQPTGFTFTYSVDAEATEEYTFSGTEKRWFLYDVVVDTFAAGTGSPVTLTETPIQLKNGDYALSVILDGEYLTEVVGAPETGEYSYAAGDITFADVITDSLVIVYHANPAGNNWSDVLDNSIPAAIRGGHIPVIMALNTIPRVQSVTIRGTFPNEVVREMGNTAIVGTINQVPSVTADITVLDTDLQLISLLTTGEYTIPSGVTEFRGCEFTPSGISLVVNLYRPTGGCVETLTTADVMKTLYIPEISVTSEGHSTNVNGNSSQTFTVKSNDGRLLIFSGYYMPSGM